MKNVLSSFSESLSIMMKDKIIILFSLVPVLVGVLLYYLLGNLIFTDFLDWINAMVVTKISSNGLGKFIGYLITATLSVVMYFVVSWTFVLIVSLIASPFNDIISNRAEKKLLGEVPESIDKSFSRLMKRIGFTLINEIKKISFILAMTFLALMLNFVPILAPVSFVLSALLLSIGFVDYTWSRKDKKFVECLSDIRKTFLGYTISGSIFMVLIAIPVVNLLTLPFAVVYYTVLQVKNES
jgi:CysZ protein